jgi:hypothetical protein
VAVIVTAEWYELRFGGVVVVPLLAVYVLFDYSVKGRLVDGVHPLLWYTPRHILIRR